MSLLGSRGGKPLFIFEAYSAVGKTRLHRQVENQNEHAI